MTINELNNFTSNEVMSTYRLTYAIFQNCTIPCHAMPCHAMPCHAMPCHAMPCHAMPCHTIPYHTLSCQAMPCHADYITYHLIPYHILQFNWTIYFEEVWRRTNKSIPSDQKLFILKPDNLKEIIFWLKNQSKR